MLVDQWIYPQGGCRYAFNQRPHFGFLRTGCDDIAETEVDLCRDSCLSQMAHQLDALALIGLPGADGGDPQAAEVKDQAILGAGDRANGGHDFADGCLVVADLGPTNRCREYLGRVPPSKRPVESLLSGRTGRVPATYRDGRETFRRRSERGGVGTPHHFVSTCCTDGL